jgi:hypothetical protein
LSTRVPEIERFALELMAAHGCHTALLYGSRARGYATPESDVDLLFVREDGPSFRDAHVANGLYIDAFVYPESALATPEPSLLRVLGGIVIQERDGFGTALLGKLRALDQRGPAAMPDDERRAVVLWSRKMLDRFRGQRGVEADYRRMQLLLQALEDYFALRNAWFRGSKQAFAWLREHDGPMYDRFERAARADASDADFEEIVRMVYEPFAAECEIR